MKKPSADWVYVNLPTKNTIELSHRLNISFEGKQCSGTELCAKDETGKIITSAFILGHPPENIKDSIARVKFKNNVYESFPLSSDKDSEPVITLPNYLPLKLPSPKSARR